MRQGAVTLHTFNLIRGHFQEKILSLQQALAYMHDKNVCHGD